MQQSNEYYCHSEYGRCKNNKREGGKCRNDKHNSKCDIRKCPPKRHKGFKPCHMHGKLANHIFEECPSNPHNQAQSKPHTNYNGEQAHDNYCQDSRYASSDNKLRGSNHTLMPSDDKASASGGSKVVNDKYHLSLAGKCPQKLRLTNVPNQSHRSDPAKPPKRLSGNDIHWDDAFEDAYLADFEMADEYAELKNGTNLFTFGN